MTKENDERIKAFVEACHTIAAHDLLRYSAGNLSWRWDDGLVALSASRAWLADITEQQVAICKLDDGSCINGKTPSVESGFHFGVLRARPEMNLVLHFQSPFATAIACGNPYDYNFFIIPEIPFYVGPVGIVQYLSPGSTELADAVTSAMAEHNLVILHNHGLVTAGKDFKDLINRAGMFELACQILICQSNISTISKSAADDLIQRSAGP